MKRLLLVVALAGSPFLSACTPPVTIVTQPGQMAWKADQIVVRVNELQNAAIAAEKSGGLPTATTRTIVQFAVSADKVLATTPAGWQGTVLALWTETKAKLPLIQNPAILAAMSAVDVALGVL